jgi:hypothetical protein
MRDTCPAHLIILLIFSKEQTYESSGSGTGSTQPREYN